MTERRQCGQRWSRVFAKNYVHVSRRVNILTIFVKNEGNGEEDDVAARFNLNSRASAAFANQVPDEPPIPLDARLHAELRAQGQNGDRFPVDTRECVEDRLVQLLQGQRPSHPKPPQNEPLHDGPNLLDRRQVRRVRGPAREDIDPVVAEPAHGRYRRMASRAVLLEL